MRRAPQPTQRGRAVARCRLLVLPRVLPCVLACATVLGTRDEAAAYRIDNLFGVGCHERISMEALRRARASLPLLDPLAAQTEDDRALIDDLPFDIDHDMQDLGAVTLLLGNRFNDLRSNEPNDLDKLALVHGDPEHQAEHCLRGPDDDGAAGIVTSVAACRAYIAGQLADAVAGLSDTGAPDVDKRVSGPVYLELRGATHAPLPRFYWSAGQAIHALQDSFSHAYRSADQLEVVTPLNYVDLTNGHLVAERDGPPHSTELDDCTGLDPLRTERLELATKASADLLRVAVTGAADLEAGVDALFATYLTPCGPENGYCGNGVACDASNGWCNAPEATYRDGGGCLCSVGGDRRVPLADAALAGSTLAILIARRRSIRRRAPASLAFLIVVAIASRAGAQPTPTPPSSAPPGAVVVDGPATSGPVIDATPVSPANEPPPLGVALSLSGAIEKPAFAVALGGRYRLSQHWVVGLDVEYNPWLSFHGDALRPGTLNVYGTAILRFPLAFQRVNLRSTVQIGMSRQMFDLFGVPEGSIGPYFGVNLLGVDIELTDSLYLIIDPAHIAFPVPQTSGVPFSYPQYRLTIGLQFGA